jgi:ABC-2 type transport system ATP-binding protein
MVAMSTPVLQCSNLVRRFGDLTAVNDVSLTVQPGETYGLLGPNGAGKTTTISMISGLLEATSGSVEVLGERITPSATRGKSALGLVPQDIALYPDLSAADNLGFFGRLQGLSGDRLRERIATVLDVVGLTDRAKDRVDTYSGGMKRRANIAVGMLHEPTLLILDEPTVGVDPQSRNAILESVDSLGGLGMAVVYTTHYMEEAERLCDRIGIIDEGRLIAEGTREELIAGLGDATSVTIRADGAPAAMEQWRTALARASGVQAVQPEEYGATVTCAHASSTVAAAFAAADRDDVTIGGVDVVAPDLEAVFLALTGRALRDPE